MGQSKVKAILLILLNMVCFALSPAGYAESKVIIQPHGFTEGRVSQFQVSFGTQMSPTDAFRVDCTPAVVGFSSWADNDRVWTYNVTAVEGQASNSLPPGSQCLVTQSNTISAIDGTTWVAGTLDYEVVLRGPQVREVIPAPGFAGRLKEVDPVVIVIFDGPVDQKAFYDRYENYLMYTSENAPAERLSLQPVPSDQQAKVFQYFKEMTYLWGAEIDNHHWALATVDRRLIPGSELVAIIGNIPSLYQSQSAPYRRVRSNPMRVRDLFRAELSCPRVSNDSPACLPNQPVAMNFNSEVLWEQVKNSYIEYIPFGSEDKRPVRSFPHLDKKNGGFLESVLPWLSQDNTQRVSSLKFNVKIEAETIATLVLPENLVDVEGRELTGTPNVQSVPVGSLGEYIRVPNKISFYEKKLASQSLQIGVVDLNQTLKITKSANQMGAWAPLVDKAKVVETIVAYEKLGSYRKGQLYRSPLDELGISSTEQKLQLEGERNRRSSLAFPFSRGQSEAKSGLYVVEVSSPLLEASQSSVEHNYYKNPGHALAQVTDLAVSLKRGRDKSYVWVTSMSSGEPVAGAKVEALACDGTKLVSVTTDSDGVASFQMLPTPSCNTDSNYSALLSENQFFVFASKGKDFSFAHSTWRDQTTNAMYAPGVDYFYSEISEGLDLYHAIVGVNLVKPGQAVPVQLIATRPTAYGFSPTLGELPQQVRVVNWMEEDIYYDFDLNWHEGTASFEWNVPELGSAKLGGYYMELLDSSGGVIQSLYNHQIEVAEFQVPLMTGRVSLPDSVLVKPQSLDANVSIQYANGVGAAKQDVSLQYFFSKTYAYFDQYPSFQFAKGPLDTNREDPTQDHGLPTSSGPGLLEGLVTDADGNLQVDIASQTTADGHLVRDLLARLRDLQSLVVRARYQDQAGEWKTLSTSKTIYNREALIGLNLKEGLKKDAKLEALAINPQGQNVTDQAGLQAKFIKIETKVIGEKLFGGLIRNTTEREYRELNWKPRCTSRGNSGGRVLSCSALGLQPGSYALEVTSASFSASSHLVFKVDQTGRVFSSSSYYDFGDDDEDQFLTLALDKPSYQIGDIAVVSFSAPFATCDAWVTLERSEVMSSFVAKDACEKGFVEVPVNGSWAPNAFVSVYAMTGRVGEQVNISDLDLGRPTFKMGYANLVVAKTQFVSELSLSLDKDEYEPRELATASVEVGGARDGGSVTFVAIEENILKLKQNDSYDIVSNLLQMRGHSVSTATLLGRIESASGEEGDRKGGDEGGDGGPEASGFQRQLFDALVDFETGVPVTGGKATWSFQTNDKLTRFKVFAIYIEPNVNFGFAEAEYLTSQETQTTANIPPVAHTGDRYPVRVNIQNNGDKAQSYSVVIEITVRDSAGQVIQSRTLRKSLSKEEAIESSRASTIEVGVLDMPADEGSVEYKISVYDSNGKLVDSLIPAEQRLLPLNPLRVSSSYSGQTLNGKVSFDLQKPKGALAGKGKVLVSVSESLVDGAFEQLREKVSQDRFAGLFIQSSFRKALVEALSGNRSALSTFMAELVGKVDRHGFVKYWDGAERGSLPLTYEILSQLSYVPHAKMLLPQSLVQKWRKSTIRLINQEIPAEYVGKTALQWWRAKAKATAAVTLLDDKSVTSTAAEFARQTDELLTVNPTAYGQDYMSWESSDLVHLWKALNQFVPESQISEKVFAALTWSPRLIRAGQGALLQGQPSSGGWFYVDETIQTAVFLSAVSTTDDQEFLARSLAIGLINASQSGWYNAATEGWVAIALDQFRRAYETELLEGESTLVLEKAQTIETLQWPLSRGEPSKSFEKDWLSASEKVSLHHRGQGKPWLSVQAKTATILDSPRTQGLSIEKSIKNLMRDSGEFRVGDIVEVTLKVSSAAPISHVGLYDPIPGGSNIVGSAYGFYGAGEKSYSGYSFYFSSFSSTQKVIKYQYQLNNPGDFGLSPTRAEGLYMPSVFADFPNASITVK